MCNTHAVFVVLESTNVDWNTILKSLQAEQYVGFINLPADLNDWLPENIHTYSKIQIYLYNPLP